MERQFNCNERKKLDTLAKNLNFQINLLIESII